MKIKYYFSMLFATLMMGLAMVSCSKNEDIETPDVPKLPSDPFTIEVVGSTIDDLKANVSVNSGVEVANYAVGAIKSDYYATTLESDSLKLAASIVAALTEKEVDFATTDENYIFNGNATADLAAAWVLDYATEYVVAAFAVDAKGAVVSGVNWTTATTDEEVIPEPEILTDAFEIEVSDITTNNAVINVTPVAEVVNYFVVCNAQAMIDSYTGGDVDAFYAMMLESAKMTMTDFTQTNGYSIFSGAKAIDAATVVNDNLQAGLEYAVAIAAVDGEGALLSEISSTTFNVDEEEVVEPTGPLFSVEFTSVTCEEVIVEVTPSEDVPYYLGAGLSQSVLDSTYNGEMQGYVDYLADYTKEYIKMAAGNLDMLVDGEMLFNATASFDLADNGVEIEPNSKYYFVMLAINAEGEIIGTENESVTTPAEAGSEEPLFTFDYTTITSSEIEVEVTPSAAAPYYVASALKKSTLDETFGGDMKGFLDYLVSVPAQYLGMGMGMADLVDYEVVCAGTKTFKFSSNCGGALEADTEYFFAAVAYNDAGEVVGSLDGSAKTLADEGSTGGDEGVLFDKAFTLTASTTGGTMSVDVALTEGVQYYFIYGAPKANIERDYEGDVTAWMTAKTKTYVDSSLDIPTLKAYGYLYEGAQTIAGTKLCGYMTPGDDYVFCAIAVDENKKYISNAESITYTAE